MTKKEPMFNDDYDELFIKPDIDRSKKKKNRMLNKILKIILVVVGIFFSLIVLIFFITDNNLFMYNDEENDILYPLKISTITQIDKENIDKSQPLYLKLEDKKLITNKGCQFEFKENTEIASKTQTDWSIIPNVEKYQDNQDILVANVYDKKSSVGHTADFKMYDNLINGFDLYVEEKKSFSKVFPSEEIENIQTGYILFHRNEKSISNNLYRYYIFDDGTGILIEYDIFGSAYDEGITDDLTYSEFISRFKETLDFYESSIVFSKTSSE
ncbi:hypothetical protein JNUCC83_08250 [Vagococcus sp. JNUCC 83]